MQRLLQAKATILRRSIAKLIEADLRFYGIRPVPKDDPIYQQGWSISFVPHSRQDTFNAIVKSDIEAMQNLQRKLINEHSKEPEERKKWIYWLAAMVVALPAQPQLERVREAASSALKDGVDWKALYEVAQAGRPSQWDPAPSEDLIDPEG